MKFSSKNKNLGVAPIVGVVILIAIAVILSSMTMALSAQLLTKPDSASAGVNVDHESESVIKVQLDSVQRADKVLVKTALGTTYELNKVGETVEILNIEGEGQMSAIAVKDGERTVIQGIEPHSFDPDYTVGPNQQYKTIEAAVSEANSNTKTGEIIAVKKGDYSVDSLTLTGVKLIGENGTTITDSNAGDTQTSTVKVKGGATLANIEVVANGETNAVQTTGTARLASVEMASSTTKDPISVEKGPSSIAKSKAAVNLAEVGPKTEVSNSDKLLTGLGNSQKSAKKLSTTTEKRSISVHSVDRRTGEDTATKTLKPLPNTNTVNFKVQATSNWHSIYGYYRYSHGSTSGDVKVTITDGKHTKTVTVFESSERQGPDGDALINYDSKSNGVAKYSVTVPDNWNTKNLRLKTTANTRSWDWSSGDSWTSIDATVTTDVVDSTPKDRTQTKVTKIDKKFTSGSPRIVESSQAIKKFDLQVTLKQPTSYYGLRLHFLENANNKVTIRKGNTFADYHTYYAIDKQNKIAGTGGNPTTLQLKYDTGTLKIYHKGTLVTTREIGSINKIKYNPDAGSQWIHIKGTITEEQQNK